MQFRSFDGKASVAIVLILVGAGAVAIVPAVDLIGISQPGLGPNQIILALVGFAMSLKGLDLLISPLGLLDHQKKGRAPLARKWIVLLGGISLACFAAYSVLSYGMAGLAIAWSPGRQAKLADWLAHRLSFLGRYAQAFVRGQSPLARQEIWLLSYSLPLFVCTGVFLALLTLLARHRQAIDTDTPRHLFRWAAAFAAISTLACPVLVRDFWYPLAWGRMVAAGINPYYSDIVPELIRDLPLEVSDVHVRMMYGPLWALVYGIVMWFADGHALLGAMVFKVLLAGAWIGSLRLIWALLRRQPLWHQCVGIAIFGWLPVGVIQGVADGHNDVFMVFFVLLWLYGLQRGRAVGASLSLAASVLTKYVTAPLFLLDLLHLLYSRRRRLLEYLPQGVAALALLAAILGIFYRSPEFFAYLPNTSRWHFFTPREAVLTLEMSVGWKVPFSTEVVRSLFLLVVLYSIARYRQHPEPEEFRQAVLAVMSAMLFSVSSHLWPWYVLWILGAAALVSASALALWGLGVALVTPFLMLMWVVYPDIGDWYVFDIPALLLYVFALLWLALAPRRWFPGITANQKSFKSVRAVHGVSEHDACT